MKSINPATGELIKEYQEDSLSSIAPKIEACYQAFTQWKDQPFDYRKKLMKKAAELLRQKKDDYGRLISTEMGKPITEAKLEIEKCAWVCDYYANAAQNFLKDEKTESDGKEAFIAFRPLGPILAIMPWNYPFWQVIRFAAPALMAGNGALLKHASNVPGCSLAIENVFLESGFPKNLFTSLLISADKVGYVIARDKVMAVTLTGSELAGQKVAEAAGRNIKKCVLELGGSDPFIVLEDANLEKAVSFAVKSRCNNAGQTCIAAKRFIVEEKISGEFEKLFARALNKLKMGDPLDPETQMGCLARWDLRDEIHAQVTRSLAEGAKLVTGGKIPGGSGAFYPATLVSVNNENNLLFQEETFGPVAAVLRVKDADEAIRVANNSRYGLGSSLWSANLEKAKKLASGIEAGSVFINGMVKSDPRLPFGGIKKSGFGRELSHYGIKEFVNIQTVWLDEA